MRLNGRCLASIGYPPKIQTDLGRMGLILLSWETVVSCDGIFYWALLPRSVGCAPNGNRASRRRVTESRNSHVNACRARASSITACLTTILYELYPEPVQTYPYPHS